MTTETPRDSLATALADFGNAIENDTGIAQIQTARAVLASDTPAERSRLGARQLAQFHEASANIRMLESDYASAADDFAESHRRYADSGDAGLASCMAIAEVSARMSIAGTQITALRDALGGIEELATGSSSQDLTDRRRLDIQLAQGFANLRVGRRGAAQELFSAARLAALGTIDEARTLNALALCAMESGQSEHARETAEESTVVAREAGDTLQLAIVLRLLTGISSDSGDVARALEYAEEAATLCDLLGGVFHASALRLRGLLRVSAGDLADGVPDLLRSLELLAESAHTQSIASEAITAAGLQMATDDIDAANRTLVNYREWIDASDGDDRIEADTLRCRVAAAIEDFHSSARYAESVGERKLAASHVDAAKAFDVAAETWDLAGDHARAALARDRAAALR